MLAIKNSRRDILSLKLINLPRITPNRSIVACRDFEACDKFNIMNRLKEIRLSTLIICGLEDQLTPVKYSEYLKNNIPNSRLEIVTDAGHMVMLERPAEFNEKSENFIKELGHY
jgi:pimeloyl-ACP methyl ester carboxylesterase